MVKLQDFAKENGLTDRQIQRQVKRYEAELKGHFERRGQNGTWLDEFACDFLRGKMKKQAIVITEASEKDEEIERLRLKLEYKQDYIEALQKQIIELTGENSRLGTQLKLLPTVEERDALLEENSLLREQLAAERSKTFWQRLRGK